MDQIEIPEGAIDVEEIMCRIRAAIGTGAEDKQRSCSTDDIQKDLDYIRSGWDIRNEEYTISSHRPVVGRYLSKGRSLVHGEVRRYVDPVIWKQSELNRGVGDVLAYFDCRIRDLYDEIDALENKLDQCDEKIEGPEFKESFMRDAREAIDLKVYEVLRRMDSDIAKRAWLASILDESRKKAVPGPELSEAGETSSPSPDESFPVNYFIFEDRFRGSRESVKQKQQVFIRYFDGCRNVIDIGCGRGEFLELLRDNCIGARGIDMDENMVGFCRSRGLSVEKGDAVALLSELEDKSLDGVFLDQVAEHLEPGYLMSLLGLCYRKLNYGYNIIIETVNPLSLTSFINFYIDMTHKKPIHPDTLRFLLGSVGFRELEVRYFAPLPDSMRLKRVDVDAFEDERMRKAIDANNKNVDILNEILFGPQDYVIIGRK